MIIEIISIAALTCAALVCHTVYKKRYIVKTYKILTKTFNSPVIEDYSESHTNGLIVIKGVFAHAHKNKIVLSDFHFEWLHGELLKNIISQHDACDRQSFKKILTLK